MTIKLDDRWEKAETAAKGVYDYDLTQERIAASMGVSTRTVQKYLRDARKYGVIHFNIDGTYAMAGTRCEEEEGHMRLTFGLDEAVVIKQKEPPGPDEENSNEDPESQETEVAIEASEVKSPTAEDSNGKDDLLHLRLANQAGSLVQFTGNGLHAAVSGGRAVYRTVQRIKRRSLSTTGVQVSPLCGRIWAHSWKPTGTGRVQRPLDADDCAFVLAQAFEAAEGTGFTQIGMPLYSKDQKAARNTMAAYCAFLPDGRWNWELKVPDLAIVGCGVLDPEGGHRMAEVMKESPNIMKAAPYLRTAVRDLEEIIEFVKKYELPFPGDVANRLFAALPLPNEVNQDNLDGYTRLYEQLNSLIRNLNNRSVVMQWRHLLGIPNVWCVCGGRFKARALWTLLLAGLAENKKNQGLITALATDFESAQTLLGAWAQYKKKGRRLTEWYQRHVAECFA